MHGHGAWESANAARAALRAWPRETAPLHSGRAARPRGSPETRPVNPSHYRPLGVGLAGGFCLAFRVREKTCDVRRALSFNALPGDRREVASERSSAYAPESPPRGSGHVLHTQRGGGDGLAAKA
eukprot:7387376-Prymnesium_polylepis.1